MIDMKKFRENHEWYIKKTEEKWIKLDFPKFMAMDLQLRQLKVELDELNQKRNQISKQIPQLKKEWKDTDNLVNEVKELKQEIEDKQNKYNEIYEEFNSIYIRIPNPASDDVHLWASDEENKVAYYIWEQPAFDFKPLTHYELLEKRDLLDQERSAKVSWARFSYIKDWLVKLELALISYAIDKLSKKWFRPIIWPNLVRYDAMKATWFFPAEKNEVYKVNPEEDDLYLIWTSEVTMVAQHMDENIDKNNLPLRYVGFSPCYRREAWSYGKDTKGMIRVHQFEKVEMVSFTNPEDSIKEHEFLAEIEEEIVKDLWLHCQKIDICTWDLGFHAAKKYDLEAWFPWLDTYKEITSCSNCTDFQARRAKIKYNDAWTKDYLHTLNWTAIALSRVIACIVENYQTKDMKIKVPEVLKKYFQEEEI